MLPHLIAPKPQTGSFKSQAASWISCSSPTARLRRRADTENELEKELKAAGADVAAFEYVRRTREISKMMAPSALGGSSTPIPGNSTPGGELFKGFSALGNRVSILPESLLV